MSERVATLVIHPGALGDVLEAVPALRVVGVQGAVEFVGQPRLAELIEGLGLAQSRASFDGMGLAALFTRDSVPDSLAARLGRAGRVISWFGARDETYPGRLRSVARDCVVAPPVPANDDDRPVWRYLIDTVDVDGRAAAALGPRLLAPVDVPQRWRERARRALAELGVDPARPLLVVHAGAGGRWKTWPPASMARVVERVLGASSADVLVHEGPADRESAAELLSLVGRSVPRLVEPDLPLLSGVLASASAYLGADSGVSHLAASVGAPAVILYPPSTRERWAPWSPAALALTAGEQPASDQMACVAGALLERMSDVRAPLTRPGP